MSSRDNDVSNLCSMLGVQKCSDVLFSIAILESSEHFGRTKADARALINVLINKTLPFLRGYRQGKNNWFYNPDEAGKDVQDSIDFVTKIIDKLFKKAGVSITELYDWDTASSYNKEGHNEGRKERNL